jgi:hypothetical protein
VPNAAEFGFSDTAGGATLPALSRAVPVLGAAMACGADLQGETRRPHGGLDLEGGGAVWRSAAEPICGGEVAVRNGLRERRSTGPVPRRLRRRRSLGAGVVGRESCPSATSRARRRGAFEPASWGEFAVRIEGGAGEGGSKGCRPRKVRIPA